jgi:hypothetical protein
MVDCFALSQLPAANEDRIRASLELREMMFTSALRIDRGVNLP